MPSFVPVALVKGTSNHWCVCQERLRVPPLQKREKKKTSGHFFIEVLTLPRIMLLIYFHIITKIAQKINETKIC